MSKFPLRGDGIEIRKNGNESDEDRKKYNIHVDESLFNAMMNREAWKLNEDTGRRVFGYVVDDQGFEAAAGDDKCT